MRSKPSWVMPEMITLNNSKVLIPLQVNFTAILLIELEITYMCVCASLPWVKNSEIVSENSLLSSTSVLLIGSYPGPNKLWFQSPTHSCPALNNLTRQNKLKNN
jgi:hypothetical protein